MSYQQGVPRGGGGGRGRGGRGGGHHHGGGGGWGWGPRSYYYGYSPYDSYWPPYTYIAQQPSDSDADTQKMLQDLSTSAARRQEQSRWLMYLVGLLIVIAVVGLLLVKQ